MLFFRCILHGPCRPGAITQGLYSLSGKTSYRKISWNLEAARFGSKLFQSLWNLAGTSAALLPRCLSNIRAIRPLQHTISGLRDFARFGGKTSYRLVNRGPGYYSGMRWWSLWVSFDDRQHTEEICGCLVHQWFPRLESNMGCQNNDASNGRQCYVHY